MEHTIAEASCSASFWPALRRVPAPRRGFFARRGLPYALAAAIAGGIAALAGGRPVTPVDDGRPIAAALSGDARAFANACEQQLDADANRLNPARPRSKWRRS